VRERGLASDTFMEWIDFSHHCMEDRIRLTYTNSIVKVPVVEPASLQ